MVLQNGNAVPLNLFGGYIKDMNKYCIWCDKAITETRKNNKLYCSDKCVGDRHTANNKNEGLGPVDYKDHPNGS